MTTQNPIGSLLTKGFKATAPLPGLTAIKPCQEYPRHMVDGTTLTHVNGSILRAVTALVTGLATVHANGSGSHITVTASGQQLHLKTDAQFTRTVYGPPSVDLLVPLAAAEALLAPGADRSPLHAHFAALGQAGVKRIQDLNDPATADHVLHLTALIEQALVGMSDDTTLLFEDGELRSPARDVTEIFRGQVVVLAPSMVADAAVNSTLTARLRRWVAAGLNVLLTGPTSTFKTTAAISAAADAGAFIIMVGGRPGMEDRDLFGATYPTSEGPRWVDGPVTEAFNRASQGTLTALVLNELTRFEQLHLGAMIGALDDVDARTARQMGLPVPEGSPLRYYVLRLPTGNVVWCPTTFLSVIGTTNIGSDYVTAQDIDAALMRRFHRHEDVPYAEADQAMKVIAAGNDPTVARAAYELEIRTRTEVLGSGLDGEGLLQREMNPSVSAALAQEATQLIHEGLDVAEAFVQAAQVTCVPYCVPRLTTGRLDPAALERFKELIQDLASTL